MNGHVKGLLMTVGGVTILSSDALLIRLIGADHWTIIFWRGLLIALVFGLVVALRHGRHTPRAVWATGGAGLLAGLLLGLATCLFVASITFTSVANTLVIGSAIPLFGAMFGRLFLGEAVPRRTAVAIAAALGGIAVVGSGSLEHGGLTGDLLALLLAVTMGGYVTVLRRTHGANLLPALALSGVCAAAVGAWWGAPLSVPADDFVYMALLGGVVIPSATALIASGPRYLPAAEVSLVLLLETVLGPLWVWLALGEMPSTEAFIGGSLVLGALVAHSALALRAQRPAGAAP